jgi:hypothetical protein
VHLARVRDLNFKGRYIKWPCLGGVSYHKINKLVGSNISSTRRLRKGLCNKHS